ncbi:MAG: hypothetical protein PHO46_05195 [Thermoguttaceae bacterium]|jgi:hypothetical protein|nr:hypothetical protein [Thermoguttaceae bacterium]
MTPKTADGCRRCANGLTFGDESISVKKAKEKEEFLAVDDLTADDFDVDDLDAELFAIGALPRFSTAISDALKVDYIIRYSS